jgi:glutamate N-acetyltransferase/amino-acid N-acetyltransferase
MAVGHFPLPRLHPVAGVDLVALSAGIKTPGRKDVVVMALAEGSQVAGVYTQNAFCAAPVKLCKQHMPQGDIRLLLINSGNANACTGEGGLADALQSCQELAATFGFKGEQVLPFSTGVIGERLPMDKLLSVLPEAKPGLANDVWAEAASGIMTTDTREKGASIQFEHEGEIVTVTGIAKGSGMINPNMATMLSYIATDLSVDQDILQSALKQATDASFNRITVDGDTSTNDSNILVATGQSKLPHVDNTETVLFEKFSAALTDINVQLAKSIVGDGEGATKLVTINVSGGKITDECTKVAYAVAHSPLVKTALFASDANWGRIVAAIGYAGVEALDDTLVKVYLDDVLIVENGGCAHSYTEAQGALVMKQEEITISIDLGRGDCRDRVWTTDLSHDYVSINADYRS